MVHYLMIPLWKSQTPFYNPFLNEMENEQEEERTTSTISTEPSVSVQAVQSD